MTKTKGFDKIIVDILEKVRLRVKMFRYKIADVVFDAKIKYKYTYNICLPYLYEGEEQPKFTADITDEEILVERAKVPEGQTFPDAYLESLALFRKLCEYLLDSGDGLIFHSSALMVDGNAYLFTAPSGTGKSTHTRLWRELLGDRVTMINDDKPIIRYIDGEFYVYGTPWTGKHRLGENTRGKIKAICRIYQAKENQIRVADNKEMIFVILGQTIRPDNVDRVNNLTDLIDKMLSSVDKYCLGCNMDISAAELAYKTMLKGE